MMTGVSFEKPKVQAERAVDSIRSTSEGVGPMMTGVFGKPGFGKTEGQVARIVGDAQNKAVVLVDPQASLCIRVMMYLLHLVRKVIYIRLRDIDRTLGFINLKRSDSPNALKRMQEDRDYRMVIARLFLGRRSLDPSTSPLIWEWLEWGLRLIQYTNSPLYWLPYCYQPERREFTYMLDRCQDRETRERFLPVRLWSPTKIRQELSPSLRVVETVCLDPAFIGACGDYDLEQAFREKKIIIVEGQGANKETVRTICLFTMLLAFQFSEREKSPIHVIADEVENFDLITPEVIDYLNTLRKQDGGITFITQCIADKELLGRLLQALMRTEWYACGYDMASVGAKEIGIPQLSRDAIWYTEFRKRQKHAGYFEKDGKLVSEYADDIEPIHHYQSSSEQLKEFEKKIMTAPVGVRYVNHCGQCFREKVKLLEEPYPWGVSEKKVERAIAEIQQRPEYRTPNLIGLPEQKRGRGKRRGKRDDGDSSGGMKRTPAE